MEGSMLGHTSLILLGEYVVSDPVASSMWVGGVGESHSLFTYVPPTYHLSTT